MKTNGFRSRSDSQPPTTMTLALWTIRLGLLIPLMAFGAKASSDCYTNIGAALPSLALCAVEWGDYDGDGDLDLLLAGHVSNSTPITRIYRNSAGTFANAGVTLPGVLHGAVTWGDYDGDGDLDVLLAGDDGSNRICRVYRNDGGALIDIAAGMPGVDWCSVAWGDYDNDGDLDILMTGYNGTAGISRVYRNDGGSFVDANAGLLGVQRGGAAWGDYDHDGDLDILLAGNAASGLYAVVYRNQGGAFVDVNAGMTGFNHCAVSWGDFDGDGDLDALIGGEDLWSLGSRVYRNDNGTFVDQSAGLPVVPYASVGWGDYDNDGDLDVLLAGWGDFPNPSGLFTRVYRNQLGAFADAGLGFPGAFGQAVAWGDYDGDGDLDLVLAGDYVPARIYRNDCAPANAAPTAPTNLSTLRNGGQVTFSWAAASDDHTPGAGLSYNLRIGTAPGGNQVMAAMAESSGYRQVARLGDAQGRTSWTLNLPAGSYYWSVQAIDGAFVGSAFNTSPMIASANPAAGGDAGLVTVTMLGQNFQGGAAARLTRSGQPDIVGTQVLVAPGGQSLTGTFDLTGKASGAWNVVITNPDLQTGTLANGITIQSLQSPQLRVSVVGPDPIRAGYPSAFDLVVENQGNVDALAVPVWIAGIPTDATVALDFTLTPPPQAAGEPNWSTVPLTFTSPGGQYLAVVIPRVSPGTITRRIRLNVPASDPSFQLVAALTPSWTADPTFGSCMSSGGITNPSCMGGQLTAINSYLAANPQIEALGGIGLWAKVAWQCEGAATLPAALAKAEQVMDFLGQAVETQGAPIGCGDALLPRWWQSAPVQVVFSIDPNDKLGPVGTISTQQSVPYSIRFENQSNATAAARQVSVVDPLPVNVDLNTLSLEQITFGTVRLLPAPGSKQYSHDVDLGHDNLLVRVSANLDLPSRQLTWLFTTLDKTTLQPPINPLLGFLPPNVAPPQGEGSVEFTVRPASSATTVQNSAMIIFDGSSQTTPAVSNLVDNQAPASNVLALNTPISTSSFPVSCTTTGSPQDFKDFTVYVAEDGGSYTAWKQNTLATTDTYVPRAGGHSYAFYSLARDLSGNVEAAPPGPDTQTLSTTAVETGSPLALALGGARPNPASGMLRVAFTLPSRERATLELIDVAGRRVLRREVAELGPGRHELSLEPPARFAPGLYFLRLAQGGQVLEGRVVLMR